MKYNNRVTLDNHVTTVMYIIIDTDSRFIDSPQSSIFGNRIFILEHPSLSAQNINDSTFSDSKMLSRCINLFLMQGTCFR